MCFVLTEDPCADVKCKDPKTMECVEGECRCIMGYTGDCQQCFGKHSVTFWLPFLFVCLFVCLFIFIFVLYQLKVQACCLGHTFQLTGLSGLSTTGVT